MTDRFDEAARELFKVHEPRPGLTFTMNVTEAAIAQAFRNTHNAAKDEAATALLANHLTNGSIGPLMDMGWNAANKAGARLILAQKVET